MKIKNTTTYSLRMRNKLISEKSRTKRAMPNRIFKDFTPTRIGKDNRRKRTLFSSVDLAIWLKKYSQE
jgi:hypothetical protein